MTSLVKVVLARRQNGPLLKRLRHLPLLLGLGELYLGHPGAAGINGLQMTANGAAWAGLLVTWIDRSRTRRELTLLGVKSNRCREIWDIRRAAGFSSTVSLFRPLWGFHRPPAESLAGNPSIRRHGRFASCETNAVHALESC